MGDCGSGMFDGSWLVVHDSLPAQCSCEARILTRLAVNNIVQIIQRCMYRMYLYSTHACQKEMHACMHHARMVYFMLLTCDHIIGHRPDVFHQAWASTSGDSESRDQGKASGRQLSWVQVSQNEPNKNIINITYRSFRSLFKNLSTYIDSRPANGYQNDPKWNNFMIPRFNLW